ncbi:MAG: hypothetical protein M1827_001933 [Pycnora praestabilis]|nr:MAG: hypothetical protein M1827_001933 [Pycnora praestabilis]
MAGFTSSTLTWVAFTFFSILALVNGQQYCQSQTVNGKPFPSLIDVTLEDLATGLESGQFTSVNLVQAYLARINEVNPMLNAVTEINPDALTIAAQLDAMRANGTVLGPLHGIPMLIKNNIATNDKMNNTAGSYALLGAKVPRDSGMAMKLRAAGVVILGKSNLSQWANFRSFNTSNGWSAYGGQVFGAYYPQQDPSGSSAGSGVSSSIGLAFAALGTETSGSILSPSEINNLVGIKPTVGLTSRALVIPISQRQDTVGPMARTVKDAAYILSAIAGKDPNDNYTSAIPFNGSLPDYVAACNFSAFQGARIGIPRNAIQGDNTTGPQLAAFEAAIQIIKNAGATVIDNTNFTAFDQYNNGNASTFVLDADFVSDLPGEYLSKLVTNPNNVNSLADVANFTVKFPLEDYPQRDILVWNQSLDLGFNNTSPQFWAAYQTNLYDGGPGGIDGALESNNLDALILPTAFSPGVPAIVGYPVVTVPLGFQPPNTTVMMDEFGTLVANGPNIPFGISFLGTAFTEATLISFAYAFEQRTMVRNQVQPFIVPNTELRDIVGS